MRVGIFEHFGWAVAVSATADHRVIDRRRIELVEPDVTPAPIYDDSKHLDVTGTAAFVAEVRASIAAGVVGGLRRARGRARGTGHVARGWDVRLYDAKRVVDQATALLGDRTDEVVNGPRAELGPPWTKEHRIALAATIVTA